MIRSRARAVAAALVFSGAAAVLGGLPPVPRAAATPVAAPCNPRIVDGVLPAWARSGFSSARPRMHYELGRRGAIAALLFGYPYRSPRPRDHENKILWVSRLSAGGSPLRLTAQRMVGSRPIGEAVHDVVIGGPGPSIVNLPAVGCWRLTLRWSGHRDRLDLRYLAGVDARA